MASRAMSSLALRGRLLGRLQPTTKVPKRDAAVGPDIFSKTHDKFWQDYTNYYKKVCALGFIFWPLSIFVSMEQEEVLDVVREDYHPYVHMRIRTKPFPFGDGVRSLFHDPYFNAIPGEGYELNENPYVHHH